MKAGARVDALVGELAGEMAAPSVDARAVLWADAKAGELAGL